MLWLKRHLALIGAGIATTGRAARARAARVQPAGLIFTAGLLAAAVGFGGYDWRLGLIVPGAVLVSLTAVMHLIAFCRS